MYKIAVSKLFFVALILPQLTACSTLFGARPSVYLVDVIPVSMNLFETTLKTSLRIENESARPLVLAGGVHRLYINGIYVGKGMTDQGLEVPASGEAIQEVPFRVSNLKIISKLHQLIESKNFSYRIESSFPLSGFLGLAKVTAEQEGEFGPVDSGDQGSDQVL